MTRIDGIVPIIPVPFNKDESINFSDLKRLVKYCVSSGASAVCLPAYASEFYKLSENEREMVIGIAVEASANKIPVIGQANHVSSHIACEMAKRYQELGVDIISTAVPRLFPLNENDIMIHLGRIAESISLPLLVQDFNPGGPTIGAQFIKNFNKVRSNHDCGIISKKENEYYFFKKKSLNFDSHSFSVSRKKVSELIKITNGAYLANAKISKKKKSLFGNKPYFFQVDWLSSLEIKTTEDLNSFNILIKDYINKYQE